MTGGAGQVGIELGRACWPADTVILRPGRDVLDLADADSIAGFFAAERLDGVVNSAAYTAVDKAEDDIAACWSVNAVAPALLAAASAKAAIPLVQISTDYVFDGMAAHPYAEDDPVAPLGVYGASKLAGEIAIRSGNPRSVVLRTAWVVSPHRNNFVKTMLRLAATRPELRIVADQLGCPTSAADIAATVATIMTRLVTDAAAPTGVYHFVNAGEASWYDLARAVFEMAGADGGSSPTIHPITTADYPTPARRPANSRLATAKLQHDYGIVPRGWQPALRDIVAELTDATYDGKAC